MFARNREVLLDFVDIFGHAMILNERGNMAIYMWMPVSDEDEVGAHEQRVRNYHGR